MQALPPACQLVHLAQVHTRVMFDEDSEAAKSATKVCAVGAHQMQAKRCALRLWFKLLLDGQRCC